jgi:hypothetical protein
MRAPDEGSDRLRSSRSKANREPAQRLSWAPPRAITSHESKVRGKGRTSSRTAAEDHSVLPYTSLPVVEKRGPVFGGTWLSSAAKSRWRLPR